MSEWTSSLPRRSGRRARRRCRPSAASPTASPTVVVSALQYGDPSREASRPRVTLLHGAGLNAHTWDTTVLALASPPSPSTCPGTATRRGGRTPRTPERASPPTSPRLSPRGPGAPQVLVGQSLGGLTARRSPPRTRARARARRRRHHARHRPERRCRADRRLLRRAHRLGEPRRARRPRALVRTRRLPRAATRGVFLNSRVRADGRVEWKHHFAHLANALAADADAAASARPSVTRSAARSARGGTISPPPPPRSRSCAASADS
jgi:hypothetical protein